jgi:CHAT domain
MTDQTDLLITAGRIGGQRHLLFQAVRTLRGAMIPLLPDAEDKLRKLRVALPKKLQRFHAAIAPLWDRDDQDAQSKRDDAIYDLRATGQEYLSAILLAEGSREKLNEVLIDAFPFHTSRRIKPGRIDLVLERSEIDLLALPVEILPIMDPQGMLDLGAAATGIPDLEYILPLLAGFSTIVTRRLGEAFDPRTSLERVVEGKVPVKIIRNREFHPDDDVQLPLSEVSWLRGETATFAVEEPWPDDHIGMRTATEKLGVCLLEPSASFAAHRQKRSWADQIQHFSCHYTSREEDGLEGLGIRGEPEPLNVAVAHLALLMSQEILYRRVTPDGVFPAPVVFLNACGSGAADPGGGLSIVELLLRETKARAIVATSTPVDFPLAAAFARAVYEGLKDGLSLGKAIQRARWALVDNNRSPFGILYLLYGNPDLTLQPEISTM